MNLKNILERHTRLFRGAWTAVGVGILLAAVSPHAQGQSAGPGVFALRSMLQDKSSEIRVRAAEGLGRVGGRDAVLILRQGLSDKSIQVRIAVVKALGFVGGRLAITVISEAFEGQVP